ncbi:hypothetical protein Pelo_7187 [Pelomyxa schiedti]|nr:hypothetical protein Pelo_7187 [Pelomyxa schiedti]
MDNHKSHLDKSIFELVESEGHLLVRRPVSSPDFAWIETCFGTIKQNLRKNTKLINQHNLEAWLYAEAENITGRMDKSINLMKSVLLAQCLKETESF